MRGGFVGASRGTVAALAADEPVRQESPMQVRATGCLASIVLSIVLTVLLNVALRACAGPGW